MPPRWIVGVVIGCALGLFPFAFAQVVHEGSAHAWVLGRIEFLLIPGFVAAFPLRGSNSPDLIRFVIAIGSCAFWTVLACAILLVTLPRAGDVQRDR